MQDYQRDFIEFAIASNVLRFGDFTLKSGRHSPYFFNAGLFQTGLALAKLGRCYAQAIVEQSPEGFDVLFGPAYKGIPIASATAIALADQHQRDLPWCFNRKEAKTHGEGGYLVGAPLAGQRVLILDDVITAGTAIREVMAILSQIDAKAAAVVVALDRQECGQGELSAIQEVEKSYGIKVFSIINLDQLIDYLAEKVSSEPTWAQHLEKIQRYRQQYGIASSENI